MVKQLPHVSQIYSLLSKHGSLSIDELCYHLSIKKSEEKSFKSLLMSVVATKEIVIDKDNIVTLANNSKVCLYHKNKDGMGGVAICQTNNNKYVIGDKYESFAMDGDLVSIVLSGVDRYGANTGKIQHILKHNTTNLIGYIEKHKTKNILRVTNGKFGRYLVVVNSRVDIYAHDELVNVVITKYPTNTDPFFNVEIVKSLGRLDDVDGFIQKVLLEGNVPVDFSNPALNQADSLPDAVCNKESGRRIDLRNLAFVTIDGEDAKDFDDAVYCEIKSGVYHLYVAIADVSHYVTHESALDHDAYSRGTSIYFPRKVIPMLPEKLSNGLCSLNPNVDRLVMCCQMEIDADGNITDYKVYNGVINSQARLTYNQVQEWLNELSLIPEKLISNITNLFLTYQLLLKARHKRGAIDFDTVEPYFEFDENGNVCELKPRVRVDAHKLIEECMLAANTSVAEYLIKNEQPCLFRNHDRPSEEKFRALKEYLNSIGVVFDASQESVSPHDYANLVDQIHELPNTAVVQQNILRSMQLAVYAPKNIGHFGLSYDKYLHFTSPIRRYPDLLVHRACKGVIAGKRYSYSYSLETLGEQSSFTERRAEDLGRKVDSFYKCLYAKTHMGSVFDGIITSVVSFGVFVYLPGLMLDGLLHVTELGSDYFIFDENKHFLLGKKTGARYHIGQELKVEVFDVDMVKLFIDFKLADIEDTQ